MPVSMNAPLGVLRQVIHAGGKRLPSEPGMFPTSKHQARFVYTRSNYGGGGYHPGTMTLGTPPRGQIVPITQRDFSVNVFGNLDNVDYREFIGMSVQESTYAKCRGCETVIMRLEERGAHRITCKPLILSTIRLLIKDRRCVICDRATALHGWGLPLCSDNCKVAWRFGMPASFRQARELAMRQNPNLAKG